MFAFAVYLLVLYMCTQIRVWSCLLITDKFGLFTEIDVYSTAPLCIQYYSIY